MTVAIINVFFLPLKLKRRYSSSSSRENSGREQTDSSNERRNKHRHRNKDKDKNIGDEYYSSGSPGKVYSEDNDGDSVPLELRQRDEYRIPLPLLHRSISVSKGEHLIFFI